MQSKTSKNKPARNFVIIFDGDYFLRPGRYGFGRGLAKARRMTEVELNRELALLHELIRRGRLSYAKVSREGFLLYPTINRKGKEIFGSIHGKEREQS